MIMLPVILAQVAAGRSLVGLFIVIVVAAVLGYLLQRLLTALQVQQPWREIILILFGLAALLVVLYQLGWIWI